MSGCGGLRDGWLCCRFVLLLLEPELSTLALAGQYDLLRRGRSNGPNL